MKPLEIIQRLDKYGKSGWYVQCKCFCGNIFKAIENNVKRGNTKTCGCLKYNLASKKNSTHGMTNTKIYNVWYTMRARCKYKSHISFKNYGARGISVVPEWEDFSTFYNWAILNGYKEGLQIDRIDSDLNYSPDNCRFVTALENNNNKNSTNKIEYNGKIHTIKQWAKIWNLHPKCVSKRLKMGWDIDKIAKTPSRKRND